MGERWQDIEVSGRGNRDRVIEGEPKKKKKFRKSDSDMEGGKRQDKDTCSQ